MISQILEKGILHIIETIKLLTISWLFKKSWRCHIINLRWLNISYTARISIIFSPSARLMVSPGKVHPFTQYCIARWAIDSTIDEIIVRIRVWACWPTCARSPLSFCNNSLRYSKISTQVTLDMKNSKLVNSSYFYIELLYLCTFANMQKRSKGKMSMKRN